MPKREKFLGENWLLDTKKAMKLCLEGAVPFSIPPAHLCSPKVVVPFATEEKSYPRAAVLRSLIG